MLTCKFHFIFYFYSPYKSCNFECSNLLLLISNSFCIIHCNHQPCSHIDLLKPTNYIRAKGLYEVIFLLYSIGYLNHSVQSPPSPHFCWRIELSTNFLKRGAWQDLNFRGDCHERVRWLFQEGSSFYIKK